MPYARVTDRLRAALNVHIQSELKELGHLLLWVGLIE